MFVRRAMAAHGRGTPRARASAARGFRLAASRGNCFSSPQPSSEPQRYAPSSPPAAARLPLGCGRRIIVVPSFASPGEVQRTVRGQRSSRRTGQRGLAAGLPPPRAGLLATFTPPWSSATSRRCALGFLLWPHPPQGAKGVQQAAPAARNVSGQAEGSIVTPQNLSRARLATLGGCATLDRTCGVSQEA